MNEHSMAARRQVAPLVAREGKGGDGGTPIDDPRALTILSTEHYSLMTARSLVYNEAFARAGMFLAFLSATLVALGLIANATGFSDGFLSVSAAVLALDLFVGLASLGRIAAASDEDIRYLQGMSRLRHAYHEMVPGLDRYFVSSKHDDVASVVSLYGPSSGGAVRNIIHGLTTTPGMISVICAAVSGALAAVIALLATHDGVAGAVTGGVIFLIAFFLITVVMATVIRRAMRDLQAHFPRTDWTDD